MRLGLEDVLATAGVVGLLVGGYEWGGRPAALIVGGGVLVALAVAMAWRRSRSRR